MPCPLYHRTFKKASFQLRFLQHIINPILRKRVKYLKETEGGNKEEQSNVTSDC